MQIVKIWHYIPELHKLMIIKKQIILYYVNLERLFIKILSRSMLSSCYVIGIEGKKILIFYIAKCDIYKTIENKRQVSSYDYRKYIFRKANVFQEQLSFQQKF